MSKVVPVHSEIGGFHGRGGGYRGRGGRGGRVVSVHRETGGYRGGRSGHVVPAHTSTAPVACHFEMMQSGGCTKPGCSFSHDPDHLIRALITELDGLSTDIKRHSVALATLDTKQAKLNNRLNKLYDDVAGDGVANDVADDVAADDVVDDS